MSNTFIVIFQFERDSVKGWSQSRIQQLMKRYCATYVTRGVYMLLTEKTVSDLCKEITQVAELTERDFVGAYQVVSPWHSVGGCQRGAAQPVWPGDEIVDEQNQE